MRSTCGLGPAILTLLMAAGLGLAAPAHLGVAHGAAAAHHHERDHDHGHEPVDEGPQPTPGDDCLVCYLIASGQAPLAAATTCVDRLTPCDALLPGAAASIISCEPLRDVRGRAPPW
ncbi:MAG: hypothetical protein WD316_08505 [Phycisphaeraceae bacterium]